MPSGLRSGGIFKKFPEQVKDFGRVMDIISEKLFGQVRGDRTLRLRSSQKERHNADT